MIELSVILPARNEAANLAILLPQISAVLQPLCAGYELIVVDDGSSDNTVAQLQAMAQQEPSIRCLKLSRNFGKEAAITAGLDYARGAAVIIMDSDGQHSPQLLPQLIQHWRSGVHMVYTVQTNRRESLLTRLFKKVFYTILRRASGTAIPSNAGDFRLLDRKLVDALKSLPERNRFMKGLYAWPGFSSIGIPIQVEERHVGRSHYSFMRLWGLAIDGLTAFSVTPLRFVALCGVLISLSAVAYGLYLLYEYFFIGVNVPGFTTLAVGMAFLSGLQLMAIGILAEYVGRIYEEIKGRPLYVVDHEVNPPGQEVQGGMPSTLSNQGKS